MDAWQVTVDCVHDVDQLLSLRPHQVRIAADDAQLHSIQSYDWIELKFTPHNTHKQQTVLLECVLDHHSSLSPHHIQVHPWIMELLPLHRPMAHVQLMSFSSSLGRPNQYITLSVMQSYPSSITTTQHALLESVRLGHVSLPNAIQRQLHSYPRLELHQLLPIQLLNMLFVFQVQSIAPHDHQFYISVASDAAVDDLTAQVASISFQDQLHQRLSSSGFVGYDAFVSQLLLQMALVVSKSPISRGMQSHGLLVAGVHGVGKTSLLNALAAECNARSYATLSIESTTLLMALEQSSIATPFEFLLEFVQSKLQLSMENQDACGVILLDDVDLLFQMKEQENEQMHPLGSALLRLLDVLQSTRMLVLGTCTTEALPVPVKRSGRFDQIHQLIVPTERMRAAILQHHIASTNDTLATRLAALTGGYVAKDLVRIVRRARIICKDQDTITMDALLQAQQQIKPSQLQSLNVQSPSAAIAFAGYEALYRQVTELIRWKFQPTDAMKHMGIHRITGLLLYGPSGCGKTHLAKSLAPTANVNFLMLKSSELLSKYFGESEETIRRLFARARAAAPCILFFDEFDAIVCKRSFDQHGNQENASGVYARILSTFLNEMDGVGGHKTQEILVIAATNRVDALDPALLRPGRIDKSFELTLPTQGDRLAILRQYTQRMPLAKDVDLERLAAVDGRSSAALAAMCKEAALCALREDPAAAVVYQRHFETAMHTNAS